MKIIYKAIVLALCCLMTGCTSSDPSSECIPQEPCYADDLQWYICQRGAKADIFYIVSTETVDYPAVDGQMVHYADTYNDNLRAPLYGEMLGVDSLLNGGLNFVSPYYRQCSLQSFVSDSLVAARLPLAIDDVRRAFRHYLDHQNEGRPFILAGFSQGAIILLQLLQEMDDESYGRMIAAYAIGTGITEEQLKQNKHLMPARGADDTGVTICYNSVRDTTCAIWTSRVAINPVNWRTDTTSAQLITEPSPLLSTQAQKKDTMTIRLEPSTGLLCVEGYTASDYMLPLIGKDGNYHSREIWLYRDQLRENMVLRAERWVTVQ